MSASNTAQGKGLNRPQDRSNRLLSNHFLLLQLLRRLVLPTLLDPAAVSRAVRMLRLGRHVLPLSRLRHTPRRYPRKSFPTPPTSSLLGQEAQTRPRQSSLVPRPSFPHSELRKIQKLTEAVPLGWSLPSPPLKASNQPPPMDPLRRPMSAQIPTQPPIPRHHHRRIPLHNPLHRLRHRIRAAHRHRPRRHQDPRQTHLVQRHRRRLPNANPRLRRLRLLRRLPPHKDSISPRLHRRHARVHDVLRDVHHLSRLHLDLYRGAVSQPDGNHAAMSQRGRRFARGVGH